MKADNSLSCRSVSPVRETSFEKDGTITAVCDANGRVWPESERAELLEKCNAELVSRYGRPMHGNKKNPLDETFYILLSSQTDESKYQAAYLRLKKAFPSWNLVGPADEDRIEEMIRPAGLSRAKAKNIMRILEKVEADFGVRSLAALRRLDDQEAEAYLRSLPGVGPKTARCVLMYSLDREVFPVDTHNFRVLKRLGLHDFPLPIRRWHDAIQDLVPEGLRFSLHVTLVSFGRDICRAGKPLCERCPLNRLCCYAGARYEMDSERRFEWK